MNKAIAYIDGYNLFNGIREARFPRKYLWLNVRDLIKGLLAINQELVVAKYFTAKPFGNSGRANRMRTYIETLERLDYCQVVKGKYFALFFLACQQGKVCNRIAFGRFAKRRKVTKYAILYTPIPGNLMRR